MAKKKKTSAQASAPVETEKRSTLDTLTESGLFSETLGAVVQHAFSDIFGNRNPKSIHDHLKAQGKLINQGNLESAERVLNNQAHSLDTIFNNLCCRASGQENLEIFETLMRLAFKAQSQCRATLEALANIKNPPHVSFVKQANIGHNQQVNNTASSSTKVTRARKNKNQQNQLLEDHYEKRMDIGTQSTTIKNDKTLEAVGKIDGSTYRRR